MKPSPSDGKKRAVWLQLFVEEHFGVDISAFTMGEIQSLAEKLEEFVKLGVDTEEMKPANEYSDAEVKKAGYRR